MSNSQESGSKEATMEWMYKPSSLVSRDDYLLGRSVDKSFHILEASEQGGDFNYADEVEKDLTPLSIFAPAKAGPVDVIKKIKEDPLYQIQKKEEEHLKELLKNPVRMKQVREITEQQERQRRLSASTLSKKKSKHKKHGRRKQDLSDDSSSSEEEDAQSKIKSFSDIDKLISEKLNALKKKKISSSSDNSQEDKKRKLSKKNHNYQHHRLKERETGRQVHSSRDNFNQGRDGSKGGHSRIRRSRSRSRERGKSYNNTKSQTSVTSSSSRTQNRSAPVAASKRTLLDETELEKRRQEMMLNAKWRDDQRSKNVVKYREEEKKEEEKHRHGHDPDFIRKQLIEAASTGSVEKRIKSNSYNIQKSSSAMDKNFARR